jgi:hypothetical protein
LPLDADVRILIPLDSNFDVLASITPDLVRVPSSLFTLPVILLDSDEEDTFICLVKVVASVLVKIPTVARLFVTIDKFVEVPGATVFAKDKPAFTTLASSLDKTPAEDSALTVDARSGSLPVFNDFTPEVIRLVACNNDIMLFHTSFCSV